MGVENTGLTGSTINSQVNSYQLEPTPSAIKLLFDDISQGNHDFQPFFLRNCPFPGTKIHFLGHLDCTTNSSGSQLVAEKNRFEIALLRAEI